MRQRTEISEAKIDAATDEDGVTQTVFFTGLGLLVGSALLVGLGIILVMF